MTAKFEAIFDQMEMRALPLPTEGVLAFSRFVRGPWGLALLSLALGALLVLAQKGILDRVLKRLIVANGLFLLVGIGFWVLAVYLPLLRIQHALKN